MNNIAPLPASESLGHRRLVPKLIFFAGVGLLLSIGWLTGTRVLKEAEPKASPSLSQSDAMVQNRVREIEARAEKAGKLAARPEEARSDPKRAEEARKLETQAAEEVREVQAQAEQQAREMQTKTQDVEKVLGHIPLERGPASEYVHLGMQVLVSLVLLSATLFVVLSKKYDAKDKHWAYGTVGLVIGFWLNQ
jgi:hypothetical protein